MKLNSNRRDALRALPGKDNPTAAIEHTFILVAHRTKACMDMHNLPIITHTHAFTCLITTTGILPYDSDRSRV